MKNYNEAIIDITTLNRNIISDHGEEFILGIAIALSEIYEVGVQTARKDLLNAIESYK